MVSFMGGRVRSGGAAGRMGNADARGAAVERAVSLEGG
jgi:hypothetical protein